MKLLKMYEWEETSDSVAEGVCVGHATVTELVAVVAEHTSGCLAVSPALLAVLPRPSVGTSVCPSLLVWSRPMASRAGRSVKEERRR